MSIFGKLFGNKELMKQAIGTSSVRNSSGTEIIANATDVFEHIDPTFKMYTAPGKRNDDPNSAATLTETPQTHLVAYELQSDATLREMFEWLARKFNVPPDNRLCLTQHQIRNIGVQCPQLLKEDGATFLFFKCKDQKCVALISRKQDETLAIDLRLLDFDIKWLGEFHPRVIIPM